MRKRIFLCAAALLVFICIGIALVFLLRPSEGAEAVYQENGYCITGQSMKQVELSIPKNILPEEIYTTGHDFTKEEAAVFQTETTTVYLKRVQPANEGFLHLIFECSYDIGAGDRIISPWKMENGNYGAGVFLESNILTDDAGEYEDALGGGGQGAGDVFVVYARTEAVRAAEEDMKLQFRMNEITYEKSNGHWIEKLWP